MDEDPFPEETLLDVSAMFRFLSENTEMDPVTEELEWVFSMTSMLELSDDVLGGVIDAFALIQETDDETLRVEVHEGETDDGQDVYGLLLIFTGRLSPSQLESLHKVLGDASAEHGLRYDGVECGPLGEMDEIKVNTSIEWAEEVLDQAGSWTIDQLGDVAAEMRTRHRMQATDAGLDVADWMPTADQRGFTTLRPKDDIVRRLMAAHATLAWVCAPDEVVPPATIKNYVKANGLTRSSFSDREVAWISTRRGEVREHMSVAGWITENMWALAWILGNAPTVAPCEQQVPVSITSGIRDDLMHRFDRDFNQLMEASTLQPVEAIVTLEDFFYCIHNGLRNRQDVERAGLIQERRQALTWALSPGVNWDDTDVST